MKQDSIIYSFKKAKNPVSSFISYLRDCLFYFIPFSKLPRWLIRLFFGRINYVFLIHPRRSEDWYLGLPFISLLRKFFKKETLLNLVSRMPPVIVSRIENDKSRGVVLSSLTLPETLMKNRKEAVKHAIKSVKFSKLISDGNCFVGLGAWWPIITNRGELLQRNLNDDEIIMTNGHTGTLLSIYLMVEKIAKTSGVDFSELKIVIIGAGKMGANVARVMNGKIKRLSLVDVNEINLKRTFNGIKDKPGEIGTKICLYIHNSDQSIREVLNEHHIGICVTSNSSVIIKPEEIPEYFIAIDDSRPEAISRKIDTEKKMVIEGGLMKIVGAKTNYDYGFGVDQNVFGCLAETYALSVDDKNILKPTLGDVDEANFHNMKDFCQKSGVEVGDFKSGGQIIEDEKIKRFIQKRNEIINQQEKQC